MSQTSVGSSRPASNGRVTRPLLPQELVALQLYARGYTLNVLAQALDQPQGIVATLLGMAALGLGARDVDEAVCEAKRRGLID